MLRTREAHLAVCPDLREAVPQAYSEAMPTDCSRSWMSLHVYYHEDRRRLIIEWLRPTVLGLLGKGLIGRFFFVQYGLGGPHVRLRLLPREGVVPGTILERIEQSWEEFLLRSPSRAPMEREQIERQNRSLLTNDISEHDGSIHPDNTLRVAEFQAETERYGGPSLLPLSLGFFCASSLYAQEFLVRYGDLQGSRRAPQVLRWLLRQAVGFSEGRCELISLLGYARQTWEDRYPGLVERADAAYEKAHEPISRMASIIIAKLYEKNWEEDGLVWASKLLRHCLAYADEPSRLQILTSQLHMSANRIGLRNAEEIYFSRILQRAAADAAFPNNALHAAQLSSLHEDEKRRAAAFEANIDRLTSAWVLSEVGPSVDLVEGLEILSRS